MDRLVRIFIVEPRGTGGMIHYAYQFATALTREGIDITLITACTYELDHLPHNFEIEKRMDLWRLYEDRKLAGQGLIGRLWNRIRRLARRGARAYRLVREWVKLIHYLLATHPDVVQFGKIEFAFEGVFLAFMRWRGLRLSQICHEFEAREQGMWGKFMTRFYASLYHNFDIIFLHGQNNREQFLSLYSVPIERTFVIPHGNENLFLQEAAENATTSELADHYHIVPGEKVVLFFGNLTPSKGIPDLLRAFALVSSSLNARLLIAGYPTKFIRLEDLVTLADELDIAQKVIFDARYIPTEHVVALMGLATAVIYPYTSATQSGSLQVAYSCGKPVIATRVGGLPEVVEDGMSGYLVAPGDPGKLAGAIESLLKNPALAEQMGRYARHLSETRFSWDSIAHQVATIYRQALASR